MEEWTEEEEEEEQEEEEEEEEQEQEQEADRGAASGLREGAINEGDVAILNSGQDSQREAAHVVDTESDTDISETESTTSTQQRGPAQRAAVQTSDGSSAAVGAPARPLSAESELSQLLRRRALLNQRVQAARNQLSAVADSSADARVDKDRRVDSREWQRSRVRTARMPGRVGLGSQPMPPALPPTHPDPEPEPTEVTETTEVTMTQVPLESDVDSLEAARSMVEADMSWTNDAATNLDPASPDSHTLATTRRDDASRIVSPALSPITNQSLSENARHMSSKRARVVASAVRLRALTSEPPEERQSKQPPMCFMPPTEAQKTSLDTSTARSAALNVKTAASPPVANAPPASPIAQSDSSDEQYDAPQSEIGSILAQHNSLRLELQLDSPQDTEARRPAVNVDVSLSLKSQASNSSSVRSYKSSTSAVLSSSRLVSSARLEEDAKRKELCGQKLLIPRTKSTLSVSDSPLQGHIAEYRVIGGEEVWRVTMVGTDTEEPMEQFFFRPELDALIAKARNGTLSPTRSLSDVHRSVLHRVVSHDWFDRFVLLLIFANCIVMIMQKEVPESEDLWKVAERGFLSCFFIEMVLKWLAFGWCRKNAKPPGYFRDYWNWLDFVIVAEGLFSAGLEMFSNGGESPLDISLIRVVRTLRPLRAVTKLPELRVLVEALFKSIPMLGTTMLVCGFYFLIFAVAGVQFWKGKYANRCFENLANPGSDDVNWTLAVDDPYACGARECATNCTCQRWENPNGGITSFDHVLVALLTIFQAITLEGWVDIMTVGQDTEGAAMCVYFLLMIFLGSYIVLNLSMAVIVNKYQEGKAEAERSTRQNQRRQDRRSDARRKWRRSEKDEQRSSDVLKGLSKVEREALEAKREADLKARAEKGKLSAEWKVVDTDGSGTLDRDEVRAVLRKLGKHVTDDQLTDAINQIDEDGSGFIDYDEFETWWDKNVIAAEMQDVVNSARMAWPSICLQFAACGGLVGAAQKIVLEIDGRGLQIPNSRFDQFMCACILLNMLALSLDHYDPETGEPVELLEMIDRVNMFFTVAFLFEMLLKILALGVRRYFAEAMNVVDAFSVITGLLEKSLTTLRAIRFLRLLRLAKFLRSMQQVIAVLTKAWKSIMYIAGLLLLFIFIFTMAGMQLFGGKLKEPDGSLPRNNFDSFHWALVSVFQVLQGENWPAMLYSSIHSVGWATAVPYFVAWVVIGQYVVLNLFLAVVMAYFEDLSEMGDARKFSAFRELFTKVAPDGSSTISFQEFEILVDLAVQSSDKTPSTDVEVAKEVAESTVMAVQFPAEDIWRGFSPHSQAIAAHFAEWARHSEDSDGEPVVIDEQDSKGRRALLRDVRTILANMDLEVDPQTVQRCFLELHAEDDPNGLDADGFERLVESLLASDPRPRCGPGCWQRFESISDDGSGRLSCDQVIALLADMGLRAEADPQSLVPTTQEAAPPSRGRMLCCIPVDSCVHQACCDLVLWPWFERIILVLIGLSCITLALDNPGLASQAADALWITDVVFTLLFTVEVLVKLFCYGLMLHEGAYLRNSWNVLDFVVVVASIMNLAASALDIGWLKTFRVLRALRPLRMVSRNEGMKIICNALLLSLRTIANVGVVLGFAWFMFALMGVQLFKGKLYQCSDPAFPPGAPRYGLANDTRVGNGTTIWIVEPCTAEFGRSWQRSDVNFDSLPKALLSLFIFASGEGWPDTMFAASDIVGVDIQPERDHSPLAAYFFVIYMSLTSFFFVELFVGAIFQRFLALKREVAREGGMLFLSDVQAEWISAQRKLLAKHPEKPPAPLQLRCKACVGSINTALRSLNRFVCSSCFEKFIVSCIIINTAIMAATYEGEPETWSDILTTMNTVLTGVFLGEAMLKLLGLGISGYFRQPWNCFDFCLVTGSLIDQLGLTFFNTALFRVFRIARAIRLARSFQGLRKITQTLWLSLPALVNVGTLLFLLLFVYAVLGVYLFAVPPEADWPTGLGRHANFDDWGEAMLVLLRTMTGEDWQELMFGCGTIAKQWMAWAYFSSFVFLASFVTINLFVMIIADNFDQGSGGLTTAATDAASELSRIFKKQWAKYDPYATRFILRPQLRELLLSLGPKYGLDADGDGQVSDGEVEIFEKKLMLHYWRIPKATGSDGGDTGQDPEQTRISVSETDKDVDADEGEEEWVNFVEVLGRLHAVHSEEVHKSLPPTALERLPMHPTLIRRRIEAETKKRAGQLAKHTPSPGGRAHKRALLQQLSNVSAAGGTPRSWPTPKATSGP